MPRDRTIFTTLAAIIIASIALFVLTSCNKPYVLVEVLPSGYPITLQNPQVTYTGMYRWVRQGTLPNPGESLKPTDISTLSPEELKKVPQKPARF
ncbi:hypothetical protein LBMAG48_23940 [Phycisphaerae bacterium]|jgi:hypothetical protein|nr:hypothetical protein LBMAG48_23940 [Phycisphaerae bacterium]